MKIMQVIPLLELAGAETMCENLTYELMKMGNDVSVVSLYDYNSKLSERMEKHGVKIYYLKKKEGLDLRTVWELSKIIKKIKPNIIHTHLYALKYAAFASRLAGVKAIVHTVHNIAEKEVSRKEQKLNYLLYKFFGVTPVSLSAEIQKTVMTRYKLSTEKTPVVFNGINIDNCIEKNGKTDKKVINYIHIGRFSKQKNHELLIKSFFKVYEEDKNVRLMLVGCGELESYIYKIIKELGLNDVVSMLGQRTDIYKLLSEADVFVLSSTYEGMPMTIIEAMGTGLPVISTNVGGISSMIEDNRTGILVNADVSELASAMLKMRDEAYRDSLGKKARIKAKEEFSSKKMAENYLEIYNKKND